MCVYFIFLNKKIIKPELPTISNLRSNHPASKRSLNNFAPPLLQCPDQLQVNGSLKTLPVSAFFINEQRKYPCGNLFKLLIFCAAKCDKV